MLPFAARGTLIRCVGLRLLLPRWRLGGSFRLCAVISGSSSTVTPILCKACQRWTTELYFEINAKSVNFWTEI